MIRRKRKKNLWTKITDGFYRAVNSFYRAQRRTKIALLGSTGAVIVAVVLLIVLLPGATSGVQAASGGGKLPGSSVQDIVGDSGKDDVNLNALGTESPDQTAKATSSAKATAKPTPTPTPDPTLKKGDKSKKVQKLQERLMDLGYMDLDESTTYFGPATKYAVQLFQRQHKLDQDGIAGPKTLEMIYSKDAKPYTLLEGTRGTDVDSLQRQLISFGYLSKATGYYGTETVDAVKEFQKRNKLTVDGKTGAQTLDLIYSPNAVESAEKEQVERRRANINEMLAVARKQLGKPYILGNEGPRSFDCSGLVYYCLRQAGSSRNRYNAAGYSQVSAWQKITSMGSLQKGDLIFYYNSSRSKVGHVGIYIGGGMMIDASSANGKVVKRSCFTAYWKRMFVCGRRPW